MIDSGRVFSETKRGYLELKRRATKLGRPDLFVEYMHAVVDYMGETLNRAQSMRQSVVATDAGLDQWDRDFEAAAARYNNLYRRFFDGQAPPSEWDEEIWQAYTDDLEGPILLWTRRQCAENWGIPLVPECKGPDLLLVLELWDEAAAAGEFEYEATDPIEHPLMFMFASLERIGERWMQDASAAVRDVGEWMISTAGRATDAVLKSSALPYLVVGGLGLLVFAWITR